MQRTILYVENDEDDIFLFKRHVHLLSPHIVVEAVKDGEEGLAFLEKIKEQKSSYPHLIILDINMPGMGGLRMLEILQSSAAWLHLKVVMFTTSSSDREIEFFRSKGVPCITKPIEFAKMTDAVQQLLLMIDAE